MDSMCGVWSQTSNTHTHSDKCIYLLVTEIDKVMVFLPRLVGLVNDFMAKVFYCRRKNVRCELLRRRDARARDAWIDFSRLQNALLNACRTGQLMWHLNGVRRGVAVRWPLLLVRSLALELWRRHGTREAAQTCVMHYRHTRARSRS